MLVYHHAEGGRGICDSIIGCNIGVSFGAGLFLLGCSGSCISCEFAELIIIIATTTATCLEDCSSEQFSSDSIIGWGGGGGEGEEGIVG